MNDSVIIQTTSTVSFENATTDDDETAYWKNILLPFEVINILILGIATWLLMSMLIYGIKARRWRNKPGTSSLNSGMIYVTCFVASALLLPKIAFTETQYRLMHIENGLQHCELICDLNTVAYTLSTFATYFYLWMRQRLIYTHPYVKERVSCCMEWLSKLSLVYIIVVSAGLPVLYIFPNSYRGEPYGCVYKPEESGGFLQDEGSNIPVAVIFLSLQIIILFLSVYPAVKVRFEPTVEAEVPSLTGPDSAPPKEKGQKSKLNCYQVLVKYVAGEKGPTSPIQMAVRRLVSCTVIIMTTDITVAIVEDYAIPLGTPNQIGELLYDISSLVNIFCMLASFGFAGEVLTLCFPTIRILEKRSKVEKTTYHRSSSERDHTQS